MLNGRRASEVTGSTVESDPTEEIERGAGDVAIDLDMNGRSAGATEARDTPTDTIGRRAHATRKPLRPALTRPALPQYGRTNLGGPTTISGSLKKSRKTSSSRSMLTTSKIYSKRRQKGEEPAELRRSLKRSALPVNGVVAGGAAADERIARKGLGRESQSNQILNRPRMKHLIWKATSDQTWMTPNAQRALLKHTSTERERNGRLMSAARAAVAVAAGEEAAAPTSAGPPTIAQKILLKRMICYPTKSRWKLEPFRLSRHRLTSIIAGRALPRTTIEKTMKTASRTGRRLLQTFLLGKRSSARSLPAIWKPAPARRRRAAADSAVAADGVMETVATAVSVGDVAMAESSTRMP